MELYTSIIGWLQRIARQLTASENTTGIALATLVGVVARPGAVAFRELISSINPLFFDGGENVFGFLG